jgi:hypothetical protein
MARFHNEEAMPFGAHARYGARPASSPRTVLERLEWIANIFDTAVVIPGTTIRFGADALIGLFPGIGDAVTTAVSGYIVYEASKLGLPRHVIWRMVANVAIDGAVGAIPVAGDMFDVFWRANVKNVRLLRNHLERSGRI